MAQAIWADDFARSVPDIEEDDDEELWHVRMSSDDVKVLSLTRLDDLFRLSLVDESTLVWQPGMKSWLPLGVVAGLEPDSAAPTVPRALPPPTPPPRPVVQPLEPFGLVSAPQPLPTPVVAKPIATAPLRYQVPESVRPITISDIHTFDERGGGFGRWVLALAMIAGLAVTLYRNDVVRNLARSARLDGVYAKLEGALGGPSFGTPRSVETLTAAALTLPETNAAPSPSAAPAAAPPPSSPAAPSAERATEKAAEPAGKGTPAVVSLESLPLEGAAPADKTAAPAARPAVTEKAAPAAKSEPEKPSGPPTLDDAIRSAVGPRAGKAKAAAPASAPAKKTRRGGASDFDPLNPKL